MPGVKKFTMDFEPTTVEHLGLKLYVSLPPVIGELVSNAWDADAREVEVILPSGEITDDAEVVVRDKGCGMDEDAVQDAYLKIGRNRRDVDGSDQTAGGRKLMGRKGIGKLASFGVADEVEVRTVKAGKAICLKLNYKDMRNTPPGQPYEPPVNTSRSGETDDPDGTEVLVRKLRRKKPISETWIRRELARRYMVIGEDFSVRVNGTPIKAEDRRLKKECKKVWDVKDLPGDGVVDEEAGWEVSGWIGLVEKSSQTERGVDIFARGKAVELETMFGLKTTHVQFARAYVVGEIEANFMDEEDDNIATSRSAAHWESDAGTALQNWGQAALKFVFNEWINLQRQEKEKKVVKNAGFDKWLSSRNSREQKVAKKLLKAIVDDENIEPESAGPMLEIIKANVEFRAFQDLVDDIEESGASVETMLKLFSDWRIIEAREHLKLSDGRLEVMEKLDELIESGALEVQQIQPLFEEEGWLINPTWTNVTGQNTYSKLLRKNCKEPKDLPDGDRRMDILGYAVSDTLHVVELKRPEKTLSRKDLEQIEGYIDWARANLTGTGEGSPRYVRGVLLVGKLSKDTSIQKKMERLAGDDIRVETFGDLLERARNIYGEVEKRLEKIAPEYAKTARRLRKTKTS